MAEPALTEDFRRCSRCLQHKPASREHFSFIISKSKWHPWCKPCCAEDRRRDRAERPEHYAKIGKRSREQNADAVRARCRSHYASNKDAILAQSRERRVERGATYNATRRAKREDPAYAAMQREREMVRREANRDRYRAYAKKAWAKATPQRRLRTYFTSAICHSLQGRTKGGRSWEDILGYSAADLRAHIERQFTKGMSWDNYGDWHVDHILPVASFQFETADDPEFKACWAITNLRPMWGKDNISKSDKRLFLL